MSTRTDEFRRQARERVLNPGVILRYSVAVLAVLAATGLRFVLGPVLGVYAPYSPLALAVIVAAWFGGRGPGLVTTALGILSYDWFFLAPFHSLAVYKGLAMWALALATFTGTLISLLVGGLRKAEESVRASEEQFRTLANTIPQLCWMANADGWIFWYNQRWYEYTGTTPEQMEGWGWQSVHDPEVLPKVLELWTASIAAGAPFDMVFPLRGADGVFRPFLTRVMPMRCRNAKVVRWFGTNTDISAERKTEEALRKSHDEESARATELQAMMDVMPGAMFIARDPQCRKMIGNPTTYELLRLPPGSNVSKSVSDDEKPATYRTMKNGKEIPADELPMQKAAATGQSVHDYELELLFQDGSRRSLIGNAVPLLDASGRPRGSVGVFLDVTERIRYEERLRQMQKWESIGLLAGGVAHDFNNLLTIIMGNASAALQDCPSSEHYKDILTASERAAHLTKQLLAYAGKSQVAAKTFDLADLVSRSTHLLSASVPKRVSLVFNLSREGQLIETAPSQIEQVLMNLVINAGEAIPPQTDGRIEISTSSCDVTPEMARQHAPAFDVQPGRFVCLAVKDNGGGMDEATLANAFDPFFSTKFTGRGLGLAAVHGIVRSSKGFIDLQSSRGVGSTFRVFLPAAGQAAAVTPMGSAPTRGSSATILVVDDEDMVRKLATMSLRSQGYEVLEAKDGRDALEVLARAPMPALALVDLAMPVMGGDELVPILNRNYPDLKIVVSSGYPEEEARKDFPSGAVTGFLQKPYTVATLAEKVGEVLKSADSGGRTIEFPKAG